MKELLVTPFFFFSFCCSAGTITGNAAFQEIMKMCGEKE